MVLSAIFLLGSLAFSQAAIPATERQALIALYTSTNGESWTDKTGWKTPPLDPDGFALPGTEASWYGLTVDSGTQRVTQVIMPNNNLTGSLPAEVGNLTNLKNLNLSGNLLTGSIPAEIGDSTALQEIDLSYNQLTGPLPATLGNLTALQRLYATNNQLSGPIPAELGNLPNLTYIYLNTNRLSGSIPAELGNMANLRHLFLYSNELSGPIPPELGSAISLQSIVLRYNQLSGEIPAELGNLTSLLVLRLGDNQLSGEIPAELGNLTSLQSLRLGHNHLSGEIPDSLGNLTQLWEMFINSNRLTGPIPASLANLTGLADTDIGYNALYTSDEALITFLNSKDPNWASTQTIAPTQVTATSLDNAVIMVSWLPVTYTADAGYYKVMISQNAGGPYTLAGQTANKTTASVNVTGLTPGTRYYFVVQTVTNAHANNPNIVESAYSTETTAIAWLQTQVQISGTVTAGVLPLSGVVMGGLPDGTVTDALGTYSATVDVDFSGTVTPALSGYTFDPLSRTYSHLTTNQTAQGYTATLLTYLITLTSPNGGERWSVGSSHDITWIQTGLTGTVTIDLYKGGIHHRNLGTADAADGTYSWTIASNEAVGRDYRILVWQTDASDESDTDFALLRTVRADFNKDGQEDIVWRCYGIGEEQGVNVVWFMPGSSALVPRTFGLTRYDSSASNLLVGSASSKSVASPMDIGNLRTRGPAKAYVTPMDAGSVTRGPVGSFRTPLGARNPSVQEQSKSIWDALEYGGELAPVTSPETREKGRGSLSVLKAAEMTSAVSSATMQLASLDPSGQAYLYTVQDLAWEIAGVGDFDGDSNTDILWRYNDVGEGQGTAIIWYMDGSSVIGQGYPYRVSDLDWRIDRTGDFNGDGRADILWRYYGAGEGQGTAVIWYMDGSRIIGQDYPYQVSDMDWRIEGIGDFNGDGKADLLWRYYGLRESQGAMIIWYMDGITVTGQASPYRVSDMDWRVDGTGDFDGDGKTDLLWRYYGSGEGRGTTIIWYMDGSTVKGQEFPYRVIDTNWRIVNH